MSETETADAQERKSLIEILPTPSKNPTARAKTDSSRPFMLHSAYDPEKEALSQIEAAIPRHADRAVLLGLGLGYHIDVLLRRPNVRRVLVHPLARGLLLAAIDAREQPWITDSRVVLSRGPADDLLSELDKLGEAPVWVHEPSLRLAKEQGLEIAHIVDTMQAPRRNSNRMIEVIRDNYRQNLAAKNPMASLTSLKGILKHVPAIIVSAGPSLDINKSHLRLAKGKAAIIAVDAAVPPLLDAGIVPHAVVAVDAQKTTENLLAPCPGNLPLIVFPSVPPAVMNGQSRIALALPEGDELARAVAAEFDQVTLPAGGSVTNAAVSMAMSLGAAPIILVGLDLCYPDERSHASGAVFERPVGPDPTAPTCVGVNGSRHQTDRAWERYRQWLESLIVTTNTEFIDATEGGALILGTRLEGLETTLRDLPSIDVPCIATAIDKFKTVPLFDRRKMAEILQRFESPKNS